MLGKISGLQRNTVQSTYEALKVVKIIKCSDSCLGLGGGRIGNLIGNQHTV